MLAAMMNLAMNLDNSVLSYKVSKEMQYQYLLTDLANFTSEELVSIVAAEEFMEPLRWASAVALNFRGDIRLKKFEPLMMNIPGSSDAKIEPFRMAKFPVTQLEYHWFLEDLPSEEFSEALLPTCWQNGTFPLRFANHPVYSISLDAARHFIAWLNIKTGRKFRLPSELEWDFVVKGGDLQREFPWEGAFEPLHCNTLESGFYTTTPVGLFPRGDTVTGCSDMVGNVEEYVENLADKHRESFTTTRGGCFLRRCNPAARKRIHGTLMRDGDAVGFRIAENY